VLGFSDLQADIAAELVRAGLEVHVFNHRSVADILRMVRTLGGIDDKNTLDHAARELWRSNYGETSAGGLKPELVKGAGCVQCAQTGFKGRIVDFDVHGFNLLDRADQIERSYRS